MYRDYSQSVGLSASDEDAATMWTWLMQGTHGVGAFVALSVRKLVGFVHFRAFPRTLNGNEACFLDDLFVAEPFRGSGLAERLIGAVKDEAHRRAWTEVRWVTTPDNVRAARLYDRLAEKSDLITYRSYVTGKETT